MHALDDTSESESGNPYLFLAQSAPLHAFPKGLIVDQLEHRHHPRCRITGSNPLASNPKLMLDWSDDGGNTWTGGRVASLGHVGERHAVASFHQLGATLRAGRTFRLSSSSPVMRCILNADARCGQSRLEGGARIEHRKHVRAGQIHIVIRCLCPVHRSFQGRSTISSLKRRARA